MSVPIPELTSNADMYALTRAAVLTLLTSGQSVSYQGRSLSMANLAELQALETYYRNLANQDATRAQGRNRLSYIYIV